MFHVFLLNDTLFNINCGFVAFELRANSTIIYV
jgi:hypothetical protein